MYNLPEITEPVEQLEELVRKEKDAQIQRRFQMLLLLKTGKAKSRSGAARQLGVHRHTVSDWVELYEKGGIEKIQEVEDPGPEPGQQSIPPEVMEKLKERLSEPEGFGSYKEIQRWLAEEQDLELCYSTVHGIVRYDLEAKPKSPRPSHPKKRAGANRLSTNRLSGGASRPASGVLAEASRPVRLFCQDERRIGLMPVKRRRITLPGVKPIQTAKPSCEYFYLYGAVEPETGQRFFTERERLNSDCFQGFLGRFAEAFPRSHNVLVLDNGH